MAKKKKEDKKDSDEEGGEEISEEQERVKALAELYKTANKNFGSGTLYSADEHQFKETPRIPTGILPLDYALGGGIPAGRISLWFGHKSCLAGDVFVPFEVRRDGKISNHKGGTIERLWQRFNKVKDDGSGKHIRSINKNAEYWALSINDDNCFFYNKIVDVTCTGERECFEIITNNGRKIIATADHRFFSSDKYRKLSDLKIGDNLYVHSKTYYKPDQYADSKRKYLNVKHHPLLAPRPVTPINSRTKNVRTYNYCRIRKSRAVYEAHINNMSLDHYLFRLNSNKTEGMIFISRNDHVHHINDDHTDDSLDNLTLISAEEHGVLHSTARAGTLLRYVATEDTIVSIIPVGRKKTYDIEMTAPFNNFIASGFVTHNSSKTTNILRLIGNAQKCCSFCWTPLTLKEDGCACGKKRKTVVAWLDVEGVWDHDWASKFLIIDENLLLSQPSSAEQTIDLAHAALQSFVDILVIDSIAFMTPQVEQDKSAAELTIGVQARLVGNAVRKFVSTSNELGKTHNYRPTIILTNQMRQKVGVVYGSPDTQPGGLAAGFSTSVEIRTSSGKYEMNDETLKPLTVENKAKIVKNKTAPPQIEAEWKVAMSKLDYKEVGDILDEEWASKMGELCGLITVAPQRVECDGKTFRGVSLLEKYWRENKEDYIKFKAMLMPKILAL